MSAEIIIEDADVKDSPIFRVTKEGGVQVIRNYQTNTPLYRIRNDAVNADNEEEQTNP